MSLPNPSPAFRLEHVTQPGVVVDLAHTENQAHAKLSKLNAAYAGYVSVPNVAAEQKPAQAPEAPPPDTLELWLGELVGLVGSRDKAYGHLQDAIILAKRAKKADKAAADKRGHVAEEIPPIVCPFKLGNLIGDRHSGTAAVVHVIDHEFGRMVVLLVNRSEHIVAAVNYADFELIAETAPEGFFVDPVVPAPAEEPAAPPPRAKIDKPHAKRRAALRKN